MRDHELINALRRLKVETGSLACLGCEHEHNCGVHGCAIMREAAEQSNLPSQQEREDMRGYITAHRTRYLRRMANKRRR